MSELLSCPFCGSEAKIFDDTKGWGVVCQNQDCDCNARIPYCFSRNIAVAQWNTRTDPVNDEIDGLIIESHRQGLCERERLFYIAQKIIEKATEKFRDSRIANRRDR